MSAIWGIINGSAIDKMTEHYKQFHIDKIQEKSIKNAYFACGIQYFTPESQNEQLPIVDKDKIIFTTDAIIDNRKQVIELLGITDNSIADGNLLYESYKKWGNHFVDYVVGAFSCAIFDTEKNELKLYTDHMSNRSLFYSVKGDMIWFGTTPESVYLCNPIGESEKFISAYLALDFSEPNICRELTPYEGVYQLLAGTELTWNNGEVTKRSYYEPDSKAKKYRLSDEEYKKLFVETVKEAIESMIRTTGEVGCTLSSGLDSTTIACLAAPFLEKQNKKLHSFTSVPLKDYISDLESYNIADESSGVKIIAGKYPNIETNFVDCEGMDGLSELLSNTKKIEYLTKSGHNLTWLNEIYRRAEEKGIKLILKGQYGNTTISYGHFLTVYYQKLIAGRFLQARKCRKRFQRRYHVPTDYIKSVYKKELDMRNEDVLELFDNSPIKDELIKKYDIINKVRETSQGSGGGEIDSWEERIRFMYNPQGMMILALNDTMISLQYGILVRDPSKDVRLVNLLTHFPIECVLADGWERGMVRSYMRGIVPDKILDNIKSRGRQSADMNFRLEKYFDNYRNNILKYIQNEKVKKYYKDEEWNKVQEVISTYSPKDIEYEMIARISNMYAVSIFIKDVIGKYR